MNELFEEKEIIKLEKTLIKSHGRAYMDDLRKLSLEELDKKFSLCAKHLQEINESELKDKELQEKKEEVKELGAPYRESKKGNKLISRVVYLLLQEKKGPHFSK